MANPEAFVGWEAQFGDFVNGAQSIIDEFISSGEAKWGQTSDVVLLLPHGLEGQGPDHSSGRIERFLQLCAEGSMTVSVPSEPANYCHLLRAHAMDGVRRPLVVFTPKWMLRAKQVVSPLADFTGGRFRPVIDDPRFREVDTPVNRGAEGPAVLREALLGDGGGDREARSHRRRAGAAGAALPGARPQARRGARPLPERRGHPVGAGGAGQPGCRGRSWASCCRRSCRGWSG